MDRVEIETLIRSGLPGCELEMNSEGNKIAVKIVSDAFEGLNRVKRQQLVYRLLDEKIKSGELHAVSMVTQTPTEANNG